MKQEQEKPLTPKEIEHFHQRLLTMRSELLGDISHINGEALESDNRVDLSNMPVHMADVGTDNYEQEFSLGLMDSERKMLKEIDNALHEIVKGTYGICEGTGKQIGRARLEAVPYARYCVEFKDKLEKGLVELPKNNE